MVPNISPDKLAKYYPALSPAEMSAAGTATKESTRAYAVRVDDKAKSLLMDWLAFAESRWGKDAFSAQVSAKDLPDFMADRAKFHEFYDWYLVDDPTTGSSWRTIYKEITTDSSWQWFPAYWRTAYLKVLDHDHDVAYLRGELEEWSAAHPPKKAAPPPPVPPPVEPPPKTNLPVVKNDPKVEPEVSEASSSGLLWAGVAFGTAWLLMRGEKQS